MQSFFDGCAQPTPTDGREPVLRLLLLQRYGSLRAQIRLEAWQSALSFSALAQRLWPPHLLAQKP